MKGTGTASILAQMVGDNNTLGKGGLALKRVDLWNGREQLCSSIFGISAWTRTIRYGLIGLGSTLSKVGTSGR